MKTCWQEIQVGWQAVCIGQWSRIDYVCCFLFLNSRRYEVLWACQPCAFVWLLLLPGVTLQGREGSVSRLILAGKMWGAMPTAASFSSDAGDVGREVVSCPQGTPVPVKHVCCLFCSWSNLPYPLQGRPHLCLSSLQKACFFLGFLFGRTGADELMWCDSRATTAENTGRMAHFFRVGSILF